jgi:hypothetical protein
VIFRDLATSDLDGTINWLKPAYPNSKFYPASLSVQVALIGSSYVTPQLLSGTFPDDQWSLSISDGNSINLSPALSSSILHRGNGLYFTGADKLSVTLTLSTGVFSGRFTDLTNKLHTFGGVLLEKQKQGGGLFKTSTDTGFIEIDDNSP